MKGSMQAATAIGVGYLLGRRKKFRAATMLAAATAVGGTTVGGIAMKRGMKMLGNSDALQKVAPQLGQLTDVVRGDLVSAGKAAATAAVSNRMDALTDSLHDRADRVRNPEAAAAEGADKATKTGKRAAGAGKRAAGGTAKRAAEYEADDDYQDADDDYQDADDDYEDDYEPKADDDADDDEAAARPARRARPASPARSGGTSRRSPVTRTRG